MSLLNGVLSGVERYDAPTLVLTAPEAGLLFSPELEAIDAENSDGVFDPPGTRQLEQVRISPFRAPGGHVYFQLFFVVGDDDSLGVLVGETLQPATLRDVNDAAVRKIELIVTEQGNEGTTYGWEEHTLFVCWRPTEETFMALLVFLDECAERGFS